MENVEIRERDGLSRGRESEQRDSERRSSGCKDTRIMRDQVMHDASQDMEVDTDCQTDEQRLLQFKQRMQANLNSNLCEAD